ncbi:hypothetical protein EUX98_g4494 [Antrodiella citrinella]|uniref:BTB domain-containing protein n=1 Tax=Antrodiella citrinella TaxID=2447956 RepID=A0A4V3XIM0_9APHY|nr:hypothetical protein EUX98_g4494 [Antrodiella citrinella]
MPSQLSALAANFTTAKPPFDRTDADIILMSSDSTLFLVHTLILSLASPVFADMLTLGQRARSSNSEGSVEEVPPLVAVSEGSKPLDAFLRLIYPVDRPTLSELRDVADVLEVSQKYQVSTAITRYAIDVMHRFIPSHPLSVFAVSCRFDLESDARAAACVASSNAMSRANFSYVAEMDHISAGAFFRLRLHLGRGASPLPNEDWNTFSFIHRNPADRLMPLNDNGLDTATKSSTAADPLVGWLNFGLFKREPANVTLRTSDAVHFPSHRFPLSLSSPILAHQISQAANATSMDSEVVVDVPESSQLLHLLLCSCYGVPLQLASTDRGLLSQLVGLVHAARKYEMLRTVDQARIFLQGALKDEPLRAYFIAVSLGWHVEAQAAARLAVTDCNTPDIGKVYVSEMEDVGAKAYYNLLAYDVAVQSSIGDVIRHYSRRTMKPSCYPDGRPQTAERTTTAYRNTDKILHPIVRREFTHAQLCNYSDAVCMPNLVEESRNMDEALQAAIAQDHNSYIVRVMFDSRLARGEIAWCTSPLTPPSLLAAMSLTQAVTATHTPMSIQPHLSIPIPTRVVSAVRGVTVALTKELPFLWSFVFQGSRNPRADVEGPYYIIGAPDRQIEDGKARLATVGDLKQYAPYLMTIVVKTPKGEPVPYATFDWWQADTAGSYSNTTYRLRGKFRADAHGVMEVLTVAPGEYGPRGYERAGHYHVILGPGETNPDLEMLTTQLYLCPNNDPKGMETDFLNYFRAPRRQNMVQSWSVATANSSEPYMGFPELDSSDTDTLNRVKWWNDELAKDELKVVAGAQTEIHLNAKGWFSL